MWEIEETRIWNLTLKTHQFNPNRLPDDLFEVGELKHLVVGNECRLLDKRRTPGAIISLDHDGGFFRWVISDFEDRGKFWDVPFENVGTYQFKRSSAWLSALQIEQIKNRIAVLGKIIDVKASEDQAVVTDKNIEIKVSEAKKWLSNNSTFFEKKAYLDFESRTGPELLRADFNKYICDYGLGDIEKATAEAQVMNPQSGDWIIATQLLMAEM